VSGLAGLRREPATAKEQATSWSAGGDLAALGARLGVWAAVLSGPLALAVVVLDDPAPAPVVAAVKDPAANLSALPAGEAAARVVSLWLSGAQRPESASQLAALAPGIAQLDLRLRRQPAALTQLRVAQADPGAAVGEWSILIGADVAANEATRPVRRYYRVPVTVDTNGVASVLALPAPAPEPRTPQAAPALAYRTEVPTTGPLGEAVTGFLTSLLTQSGDDVNRWTSPDSQIEAVRPAAASAIRVEQISSDNPVTAQLDAVPATGRARLLVSVSLLDIDEEPLPSTYALGVAVRDGRWEIAAIDPLPALRATPGAALEPGPLNSPAPSVP
jgi:hypothetical protein